MNQVIGTVLHETFKSRPLATAAACILLGLGYATYEISKKKKFNFNFSWDDT